MASDSRACNMYPPESISAETFTHINFAFALISEDFLIQEMSVNDNLLWQRTTALKQKNPALKVFLSIGGWSFNDPPTQHIFSDLVASEANTNKFIANALSIMQAYSFDGLDIDWEYPVAAERGGVPADKTNYPIFMSRVKSAFTSRGYGLTFTAPSSYWYLQHFDLSALLKSADWVNVMTYDLHGVWDGTDPYIGPIIEAHTNLTEIKQTMQLFRNVGIDPSQIVMGIGFYGRSFQLADPSCSAPGCGFVGGADPGECSLNSGTLMYSEIQKLLSDTSDLLETFDNEAAVKYITWNGDQWVSYDDAQTLQMKLAYANSICLGGTMIWSVDQDDASYTALQGLYNDVTINDPSATETGNMCQVTGCGQSCPSGYDSLTTLTQIPNSVDSCDVKNPARLCCPKGDEPQNCVWRGGGGTSCNAQCDVGEITMALDETGDDGHPTCIQGYKAFCCQSGDPQPGACFGGSCNADECASPYVVQTRVKQGSADSTSCESQPQGSSKNPPVCPEICQSNTKPVCCDSGYTNCEWVGDPPNCLNAACKAGQVAIFSDMQGDASSSCVNNNKRYYCCDPPPNAGFLPVPVEWVLPATGNGFDVHQPATFTVDFDDNTGTSDASSTGSGSSGIGDDGQENDSPFGEVFISSPNAGSVSSMDLSSDWVITECSAKSDKSQQVLAYCTKGMDDDDSGCAHVFIGQVEHTIIRLPTSCGLGPYARVTSLEEHPDQDVLTAEHKARKRSSEKVYILSFDYEFASIPESNGPVLMRADITDIPGYWDEMINSPPDAGTTSTRRKRDFHQPMEYEKRWFGPFDDWLAKLTTVRSRNSIDRNYHWSDTYTIYHAEQQCPHFSSSLDISVTGSATVTSSFGYYLEASIVPPAIQEAYVFFDAGANAQASFTIKGNAEAHYNSERQELAVFGFPGLYYPGLLTLGPSLHLYGELSGQLSLSGQYTATVGYQFPSINYAFGKQDSNDDEEPFSDDVTPDQSNNGYDFSVAYNVNLEGSLDAHLIPSLQLGISVLGGALVDAQVFAEADMYAGVGISGSVSSSSSTQFCINPHYGVSLSAGLTGSVLFWRGNPVVHTFYSNDFPFGGACFDSVDEGSASGSGRKREEHERQYLYEARGRAGQGVELDTKHAVDTAAYVALEHRPSTLDKPSTKAMQPPSIWRSSFDSFDDLVAVQAVSSNHSGFLERRAIPFLDGYLVCPTVDDEITNTPNGTQDCRCYSDNNVDAVAATGQIADIFARNEPFANKTGYDSSELHSRLDVFNSSFSKPKVLASGQATLRTCSSYSMDMSGYANTQPVTFFDLDNPGILDPTFGTYNPFPPNLANPDNPGGPPVIVSQETGGAIYAREHVYEVSMASLFVDRLQMFPDLWQGGLAWCRWVDQNLRRRPAYYSGLSVFEQIQNCYPGGSQGADRMVLLEQQANVFKNYAMFETERQLVPGNDGTIRLVDPDKWKTWCPTKQIARLRAAAGVASYMNDFSVRTDFQRDNACIRAVWVSWYNAYVSSNPNAPNPGNVNVPHIYDNFVHDIVAGMVPYLRTQVQNYIALYNPGEDDTDGELARLSFAIELDYWVDHENQDPNSEWAPVVPFSDAIVSRRDLTNQILNNIPDIYWVNNLPTW